MATLRLRVTTALTASTLQNFYERSTSAAKPTVQSMSDLLMSIVSGNQNQPSVSVNVMENATAASGTLTLSSVVATNTCVINGVTFTAVASGATGNQFNVGGTDTITATNLAAAINGSVTALVAGYVTATSATNVVTVTSTDSGIYGNQVTLTGSANIVASGARLTGGAVDPNAKVYTF